MSEILLKAQALKRIAVWNILTIQLILLLILTGGTPFIGFAAGNDSLVHRFQFSGFVKNNIWVDTRQIDGGREDLMLYYPKPQVFDENGKDIHAGSSLGMNAIATRGTVAFQGSNAFGAKAFALIEADFTGTCNADINGFRLRHAYGRLDWKNASLLVGQYWHPMFVPEVFPEIVSLNTGAPFQPFIRSPQISFFYRTPSIHLQLAAVAQRDNSSDGPEGRTNAYLRHAVIPNMNAQLQLHTAHFIFGAALDYKILRPLMFTMQNYATYELVKSSSLMVYGRYKKGPLTIRYKGIIGQNLTEHLMLGGYAVKATDPLTGVETYTPTNHFFTWGGLNYGTNKQWGLFGGFAKNLGTSAENIGIYYGKGSNVDWMYRISPTFSVRSGHVKIASELEYTVAAFGTPDSFGKIKDAEPVANLRLLLALFYYF